MTPFRYEASDSAGIPVYGTAQAVDQEDLKAQLSRRGLTLVRSSELSLKSMMIAQRQLFPRLSQLRIGEQVREALLTGLPAHEAVRAIAAEPMSHPMLGVAPWLQVTAVLLMLVAAAIAQFSTAFVSIAWGLALVALVAVPLLWWALIWIYKTRPRQLLNSMAERLETGSAIPVELSQSMPGELRYVLSADIDDESKARVAADLVPAVMGGNMRSQQFLMTMIGPMILMAVVLIGVHGALLFVVPRFGKIFDDFGTELPAFTKMVVGASQLVDSVGTPGWLLAIVLIFGTVILTALALSSGMAAETLEKIPLFGIAFRWGMQAKVARILAAMIRNNCDYVPAIHTATMASGFQSVKHHGRVLTTLMENQDVPRAPMQKLSGLPMSMLFVKDTGQDEQQRRIAISDTFQNLSEMLDAATVSQGRLLAVFLQFGTIVITGILVGTCVLAMFLPLIKLLNDLS